MINMRNTAAIFYRFVLFGALSLLLHSPSAIGKKATGEALVVG